LNSIHRKMISLPDPNQGVLEFIQRKNKLYFSSKKK